MQSTGGPDGKGFTTQFPLSAPDTVLAPGSSVPTDGPNVKLMPPRKSVVVSVKSIANAATEAARQSSKHGMIV